MPNSLLYDPSHHRLSDSTVDDLVARGTVVRLRKGQHLFREADRGDQVFLVRSGQIKVALTTPTGRELLLALKLPGDLVGELSAIDGDVRSAAATATEASTLVTVSASQFLGSLEREPKLALALLRQLSRQIRVAGQRSADRVSADTKTRLAHRLIELSSTIGLYDAAGDATTLHLTQDDLAGWIGATREATARALAELRSASCVSTARQRVTITNIGTLTTIASGASG